MKLEDIFKAKNLPPVHPMSSPEGQDQFVPGQSRPSGNFAVDVASGIWGLPTDRVVEIFGEEGTGKTTLALQKCAYENGIGKKVYFIDVEHALDWQYALALGINPELFYIIQPTSAEEALRHLMACCYAEDVGVAVLDTVAALTTQAELDGEVGDHHIAQVARLMSTNMKQLVGICSVNETLALMLNQNRVNPGAYGAVYQPGGRALRFYASQRISLRKVSTDKTGDVATSNEVEATFKKNKLAPPFRVAKYNLIFGKGTSNGEAITEEAIKRGIMEKRGAWIAYKGSQVGQGLENCGQLLDSDKALSQEIIARIKETEPKPKVKKKAPPVAAVSKPTEGFIKRPKLSVVRSDFDEE